VGCGRLSRMIKESEREEKKREKRREKFTIKRS
jgi:hypothetical protein